MPPHCDTLDGPVVTAAKRALETGKASLILPYAPEKAEPEIKKAFEKTLAARKLGGEAKNVAELWFFETVVRLHREGEGAPYTGLKPAGLDWGPVLPKVDKAIESGDPKEVIQFLSHTVEEQVRDRFKRFLDTKDYDENDVASAREHVEAMLGLELYSHHLYQNIKAGQEHGEKPTGGHQH